jgi:heavy metal sensor kinase
VALQIRTRLTAWYSSFLLIALLTFGVAIYIAIRSAILTTIDVDLQDRLVAVEKYMKVAIPRFPRERLWHEFAESVEIQPGGEMMQVSDSAGSWIFQSESIIGLKLAPPSGSFSPRISTLILRGVPVRVQSAAMTIGGQTYFLQLATTLGHTYEAVDRIFVTMLCFIPLLVIFASGGGYWISVCALAPVDRIIADSRSISFSNLSRRLMVPQTGDELQRLSETLNEMIQRLELAFFRNAKFTADASHELRTPVALIRTTAEVALLQPRELQHYQIAMSNVLGEAERMSELIDELLTLARTDAGASCLKLLPIDVRVPLQYAYKQKETIASGKHIRFRAAIPDHAVLVLGDMVALQRLFLILVDNALKYTPEDGMVDLNLTVENAKIVVTVRDSGIGIADADILHIFERFYRSDKARQRDTGGSGLGLAIGKWIAEAHHAEIQVESELNLGSTFIIHFPKSR